MVVIPHYRRPRPRAKLRMCLADRPQSAKRNALARTGNIGTIAKRLVILVLLAGSVLLLLRLATDNSSAQITSSSAPPAASKTKAIADAYGKLELSFIPNKGQTHPRVKFLSHGPGYELFLTKTETVLTLHRPRANPSEDRQSSVLSLRLVGANQNAKIEGADKQPGKVNYFIGQQRQDWRVDIPTYRKVIHRNIYPGIDLVYYGNQRQLEYDFVLAPGADPARIRFQLEGAEQTNLDDNGDLRLTLAHGEVRLRKPAIYQVTKGGRHEVDGSYVITDKGVAFKVGSFDRSKPLIIDPLLIYSTFLGGSAAEQGLGVAVDSQGNAYVTGSSNSTDFPLAAPFQGTKDAFEDAFVLKLNPAGTGLVYSTYFGGNGSDVANSIAIDLQGNAYIAGLTGSGGFPTTPGAFQTTKSGFIDAFVTKLNASGSALIYSTFVGGDNNETIFGVTVDANNRAYVVGRTDSTRLNFFPLQRSGSAVYKSINSAGSWLPSSTDLTASLVNVLTIDPASPATIYAGTNLGVFKTTDAGGHWNATGSGAGPVTTNAVGVDPSNSAVVYAGALGGGVYKSTNGGLSYIQKNTGLGNTLVNALVIDPTAPTTIYVGTNSGIFKSTNGADNWAEIRNGISGTSPQVNEIAIDPTNPNTVYMGTNRGMFKSTNGGALWTTINGGAFSNFTPNISALVIDPLTPSTLFASARIANEVLFKSIDGGATWTGGSAGLSTTLGGQPFAPTINTLAIDPVSTSTLYAATSLGAVFKSTNAGANWSPANTGLSNSTTNAIALDRTNPATVYTGTNIGNDAFIIRFNPDGSVPEYLIGFGGDENDEARGVALDSNNNAYVIGTTSSPNFPIQNAFQSAFGGLSDAFVTKVNSNGTAFSYSTFLGGNNSDLGRAIAVRSDRAYVAGQTLSANFPLVSPIKSSLAEFDSDAFVGAFNSSGSALDFSTYLGGEAFDQALGIALDSGGSIYVTGSTQSMLFPVQNASQPTGGGSPDAFITRFTPAGTSINYSTYLGGFNTDIGNGIALDPSGNAYVVGNTSSPNFPTVNPFQSTLKSTDAFITKIGPAVDLAVTMTDSPDPVLFGNDLTYTIEIKNNGELAASGVTLTDTLPAGASLVSTTITQGSCAGTTTITCNLDSLGAGAAATVTIIIKPPASLSISNTASVSSTETDPNQTNNSTTQTTQVQFAELSISKSSASTRVAAGSQIVYLITVRNNQGLTANNVTLTDNLPGQVTFVSCSSTGVCGGSGNNRTVTFSSVAVGQTVAAVIVAQVNSPMAEGTVITNSASVSSALPDNNAANNSSATNATVAATAFKLNGSGKIAFSTSRVFTANSDGATPPAAIPNIPNATSPAWSPDGTKIAFLYTVNEFSGLVYKIDVANADGTGRVQVANNIGHQNRKIAWSPSGTKIAYLGNDTSIYIGNADGSGIVKFPNSPTFVNDLDWSPDGTRILLTQLNDLYVMDMLGTLTKISNSGNGPDGAFRFQSGRWSPDMTKILCERRSNNYRDIMVMNADGSGLEKLVNAGDTAGPSWSGDGAKVAYYVGTEVHVMNFDGSDDVRIATGEVCCGLGTTDWQRLPDITPPPPPAPGPTFSISGHIPFPTFLVLSGTRSGSTNADSNGVYSFGRLPVGGNYYTITPQSHILTFTPTSRTYNNLAGNITDADFTVSGNVNYSVSGRATDRNGAAIVGAEITLVGGFPSPQKTNTDANGRYVFNNLEHFRNYSVFASLNATYKYFPDGWSFFFGAGNTTQVVDFKGYTSATVTISGRVANAASPGTGISGADVRILNPSLSTVADSNGNFSFANLEPGRDYTVTVNNSSLLCVPNQVLMTSVINDQTAYFTCHQPRQLRTISGRAVDSFGNNMSNMLVYLTGAVNTSVLTAADGSFTFSNVPEGFNYTVRPHRYGFSFAPSKATIVSMNGNSSGNNFVGTNNTAAGTPTFFEFESTVYSAAETTGSITITVKRSGNGSAASVKYETVSGTAVSTDYTPASGTLSFGLGETVKTFTVSVNQDGVRENPETVFLVLTNPAVGFFGVQSIATLTITDNDSGALRLLLDQSGPSPTQATAFDSLMFVRDPFKVLSPFEWWNPGADRNTRVIVFATNLTLNPGETAADVVVTLVDSSSQTHNIAAEDVRAMPDSDFTQVRFRLPNGLPAGNCAVEIKAHGQTSNTGSFRVSP